MERFIVGDIVVIPFPFTDLSANKKRPALIVADIKGDDLWMVQITSKSLQDDYAIPLSENDLFIGSFNYKSNIRPNKIFTLSKNIILYKIGTIKNKKLKQVHDSIINILHHT